MYALTLGIPQGVPREFSWVRSRDSLRGSLENPLYIPGDSLGNPLGLPWALGFRRDRP